MFVTDLTGITEIGTAELLERIEQRMAAPAPNAWIERLFVVTSDGTAELLGES